MVIENLINTGASAFLAGSLLVAFGAAAKLIFDSRKRNLKVEHPAARSKQERSAKPSP